MRQAWAKIRSLYRRLVQGSGDSIIVYRVPESPEDAPEPEAKKRAGDSGSGPW